MPNLYTNLITGSGHVGFLAAPQPVPYTNTLNNSVPSTPLGGGSNSSNQGSPIIGIGQSLTVFPSQISFDQPSACIFYHRSSSSTSFQSPTTNSISTTSTASPITTSTASPMITPTAAMTSTSFTTTTTASITATQLWFS
ncbi:hypothetical protein O181_046967 [Austropuccinia psidii MF-1]|uniref:Uncharacterized protein n=1 Tax=Austropuccinia psidii MF-1 TaxID=1389203 RepID=A0A9Q3HK71_9BASI|nr:hypothetical protein [Austropuccinia psidii MF-1]